MTENISPEGLCIRTNAIHPKNSYIRVDLTTPSHERVVMIGRVCWAKRVPPNLARLGEMGSMGIQIVRFLAGSGVYLMLCEAVASRNTAEPDTY